MRRIVFLVLVLGAVIGPGLAHAAPPVARPNPALFGIRLDYRSPLPSASGGVAQLEPLDPAAAAASFDDVQYLTYRQRDDLGGFLPAPIGGHALASGGRNVVGGRFRPQLPLFAQAAGGGIRSYTFTGGSATTPPENGRQPVPGLGVPPTTPPPAGGNVPPPNQGFGGRSEPPPTGGGTTGGTTTTGPNPPPPPTTTRPKPPPPPTTTTTTPTTTTTTTTTTPPPPPGTGTTSTTPAPPPTFSCGGPGIAIESNLSGCRIDAVDMAPGDSATERVTITNTSGTPYTLALRAVGSQNHLWDDLQMGVWEQGGPPPTPLPPLSSWVSQFNDIATLQPGESISLVIELYLPTSAGNEDQNLAAVIAFLWRASG